MGIGRIRPGLYRQIMKLDEDVTAALNTAGVPPLLVELVKIRISQINGCAFCLRMHTRSAIAKGESTDRLAVIAAWWESQYFTDQEQAALALAEQVTTLEVPERRTWDNGSLTEDQASALTWLATAMNRVEPDRDFQPLPCGSLARRGPCRPDVRRRRGRLGSGRPYACGALRRAGLTDFSGPARAVRATVVGPLEAMISRWHTPALCRTHHQCAAINDSGRCGEGDVRRRRRRAARCTPWRPWPGLRRRGRIQCRTA